MNTKCMDPFETLAGMQQQVQLATNWLQAADQETRQPQAMTFTTAKHSFICPIIPGIEVIATTALTPLPWVQPWVEGLLTHNQQLIPIIALATFLQEEPSLLSTATSCYLLINRPEKSLGFAVKKILGLSHFVDREFTPLTSDNEGVTALCDGQLILDGQSYYRLSAEKIFTNPMLWNFHND